MPVVAPLDLSPEERSFFEAGDAIDQGPPAQGQRRRHSQRHDRRTWLRRLRKLRGGRWLRVVKSVVVIIAVVWIGYRMSMLVAEQTLPDTTEQAE